jgi:hypothetical protein
MENIPLGNPKSLLDVSRSRNVDISEARGFTSVQQLRDFYGLHPQAWFFVTVNITHIAKPRAISVLSNPTDTVREYAGDDSEDTPTNPDGRNWKDQPGTYVLNHITLEDACEFLGVTYDLQPGGVYFDPEEGTTSLKEFTESLFNARKEYKAEGNALEGVIKLVLNSFYGKMIEKFRPTTEEYFEGTKSEFDEHIQIHFHTISNYEIISEDGDRARYRITKRKASGLYSSKAHIASVMYSVSKRVMNRLIYILEDANKPVYYTDTDSVFIDHADGEYLKNEFLERYDYNPYCTKETGSRLGLLHSDFPISEKDIHPDHVNDVKAGCVFFGKKFYSMKIRYTNTEGLPAVKHVIKIKGIPPPCIDYIIRVNKIIKFKYKNELYTFDTSEVQSLDDLERILLEGRPVPFDLANSKPCFKACDSFITSTKTEFIRVVKIDARNIIRP